MTNNNWNMINGELCASVDCVARALGLPMDAARHTVETGLYKHRQGRASWRHHADDADARMKWIVIDSLPSATAMRLHHHYGDVGQCYRLEVLAASLPDYTDVDDAPFYRNVRVTASGEGIGAKRIEQLCEALAWLRLLKDERGRAECGGTLAKYYEAVSIEVGRRQLYGLRVKNGRVLRRKVTAFGKVGRMALLSKKFGNANSAKLTDDGRDRLVGLYASPLKPSFRNVAKIYNREAPERGWDTLTEERVRQILSTPMIQQLTAEARHGLETARNRHERTIKRRKASFPDALWSFDGTTVQLRYTDAHGQLTGGLYVVFVMDVHSDAVLGVAIEQSGETALMVQRALRDACRKTGMLPYQTQYDNASANVGKEMQQLLPKLQRVGFPAAPYNGKAKPVENLIGRLEGLQLRYMEAFKGGNITSPSADRKANPDHLAALTKAGKLPTLDQAIATVELAIATHNHTKGGDGLTPTERYAKAHPKRRQMDYITQVEAFWVKRTKAARYTKDGLTIQVGRERYTYEVEGETRGVEDAVWRRKYLGERFAIYYDPDDLEYVNLYREDVHIATARRKWEAPMAVADFASGDRERLNAALEARTDLQEANRDELDEITARLDAIGAEELSHELLHKDAYNRMEQAQLDELLDRAGRSRKGRKRRGLIDTSGADYSEIELPE